MLPMSISTIESESFKGCSSLKEIIIPVSVTRVCESAFERCSSLEKIMLPASADSIIETNSFKECNNLEEVTVCLQTKVKRNAFYKCKKFNRLIVLSDELPSNEINNQEDSIFFGSKINSSFFNSIGSEKQESILNLIADLNREDRKEKITNKQNLFKYLMNEKQQLKKKM